MNQTNKFSDYIPDCTLTIYTIQFTWAVSLWLEVGHIFLPFLNSDYILFIYFLYSSESLSLLCEIVIVVTPSVIMFANIVQKIIFSWGVKLREIEPKKYHMGHFEIKLLCHIYKQCHKTKIIGDYLKTKNYSIAATFVLDPGACIALVPGTHCANLSIEIWLKNICAYW